MSKPWGMVAVHVGAWFTFAAIDWRAGEFRLGALAIFDWTCLVVVVGCVQTIGVRLRRIFRELGAG
jgi:hypothetical protein